MEKYQVKQIFEKFNIDGDIIDIDYFSNGLINTSCKITTLANGKTKEYVLQKINKNVFKNPEDVMDNISKVTTHIKKKINEKGESSARRVLKFYTSNNGKYYALDENNDYWRMYKYIDKSIAPDFSDDLDLIEETGTAFGEFQELLSDFPAYKLNIIIPHFHNTEDRYRLFSEAIINDTAHRANHVQKEIAEYKALENIATKMYKMQKQGELKLRVTHNDTKCNNVLFDEDTNKHLCVIDLDTVMPGLAGFDFGDAIRFGASTAAEDETDLSKVGIDLAKYEAFTKGFLSKTAKSLTQAEIDTLPLGAITISVELGMRCLTDYLNGDVYFKTNYEDHNLDRARCQLTLALDMLKHYDKMKQVVNKYALMYQNNIQHEDENQ